MPSATEVFRVVGKVVLEGSDAVEKTLTTLGKSAEKLDKSWSQTFNGMQKDVPKNVTKPIDDSINKTERELEGLEKTSRSTMDRIKDGFAIAFGSKTFDLITSSITSIGKNLFDSAINMNATLETTELQFTTLMGSADKAKQHVAFLFEFAKKTPFETGPILQASRILQTYGGEALNSEKNLTLLGDAAAATSAPFEEVSTWTARLYAALKAGQPFGEAAARLQELAVMSPTARLEMEKMQKAGKSADEIFAYFQKDLSKFTGAMEKQAGTWEGLKSTLSDTIAILSAKALRPFFDLAKEGLGWIVNVLGSDAFASGAQKVADAISKTIGGAISGLVDIVKRIMPIVQNIFSQAQTLIEGFTSSFGNIQDAASGIFDAILPELEKYAGIVQDVFTNGVLPAIMDFVQKAKPLLGTLTTYVEGTIIPAYEKMGRTFVAVFLDTIAPAMSQFWQKVLPVLSDLGSWWLTNIIPRITEFSSAVIHILTDTLYPAIQSFITNIMPFLQKFADFFVAEMLPKLKEFGAQILTVWDELGPTIIPILQNLATGIKVILDLIGGFIHDHGDEIMYWIKLAWNQVSGVVKATLEIITNVINLALNLIQGDWKGAWENVQGIFKGVWDYILAIFSPAITIIKDTMSALQPFFTTVWNAISSVTTSVWNAISSTISGIMSAIQNTVQTGLNAVQNIWNTIWNAIQVVADTVWRAIETIVRIQMALVKTIMEPILNAIQSLWETVWNAIQTKVEQVWNYINNTIIQPIFNAIQTFISNTLTTIQNFINTKLAEIQTKWETVWNSVKSTFETIWTSIQSTANTIWTAISNTATTVWESIKNAILGPMNEAQTKIGEIWNTIQTTITNAWNGIKNAITSSANEIKNAMLSPFEQARDGIGGVMDRFKSNLLSPLQGALDGIKSFVNGVASGLNSISSKLGLGDIIRDTWSGARITALAQGVKNWQGGPALVGEAGTELVRLPDGTLKLVDKAQIVNLPEGTTVYNAQQTRAIIANSESKKLVGSLTSPDTDTSADIQKATGGLPYGLGGAFSAIKDIGGKIGGLAGSALDFARGLISKGAEAIVSEVMSKAGVPTFPGALSGLGGAVVSKTKDTVLEAVKELLGKLNESLPKESSDGVTIGDPGVGAIAGNAILDMAYKTSGLFGLCEKFVGDVMQRLGLRYYRASTALAHAGMQPLAPGTGPAGAVVFWGTATDPAGHVAFSEGNGNVWGTVRPTTGRRSAASFGTPLGYTLNPAANGMVVNSPTAILAGETSRARPELITPVEMMKDTFKGVLNQYGAGMTVQIYVTANTAGEGYAAGQAAAKGFRDQMLASGFNR